MSQKQTGERPVIRCYNKPGIPNDLQARFTAEGLFVADFESGWSLKSSDVPDKDHRPAAGRTFNRIRTISREGGIGLIRTPNDDDEIITVGEWKPDCATFRDVDGIELKGVQMARFGLFVPHDDLYDRLDDVFDRGGQTVDDVPNQEPLITEALDTLTQNGRLRTPTYL